MRKKELLIFLSFIILSIPLVYINSTWEFNNRVQNAEQEVHKRVKSVELMQDFLSDMPALTGAIEFQSFGQIDVMIDKLMKQDATIKEFLVLDRKLNILHSKQSDYKNENIISKDIQEWNQKEKYLRLGDDLLIWQAVRGPQDEEFRIMFRISISESFAQNLHLNGISGVSIRKHKSLTSSNTLDFKTLNESSARMDFFFSYLLRNVLNLALFIILLSLIIIWALRWLISPFREITFYLKNLSSRNIEQIQLQNYLWIFKPFIQNIVEANKSIVQAYVKEREIEIQQYQFKVAQQVAHDIRSPLEALKSSKEELSLLPEHDRLSISMAINRIEEIAYNLLKARRSDKSDKLSPNHLISQLDQIIIEKKMQYRDYNNLKINFNHEQDAFPSFSKINPEIFKRIVSNLITNSAEATFYKGEINIQLSTRGQCSILSIMDTGPGFTDEIKSNLFQKGFTTKSNGNGLGLYNAKQEIESVGGSIDISSGIGAFVIIKLPLIPPPDNFPIKIDLRGIKKIIILDDDENIHQVWKKRFSGLNIEIEHFYSSVALLSAYLQVPANCLLLSDYELLGDELTGLDCIKKLKAHDRSILVTARFDERDIQEETTSRNLKLLPKCMANHVPIMGRSDGPKRVILIDDDKLTHLNWKIEAKKNNVELKTFFTVSQFMSEVEDFSSDTIIFIDSNLGNDVKGEVVSEEIFKKGFKELYLATGYEANSIDKPYWIKKILGKRPCFEPSFT